MARLDLGVGIVAVPGVDLLWDQIGDVVDVLEVEPQAFWTPQGETWTADQDAYDWLLGCGRPIICHGVGFPVGGSCPPTPAAVALFAEACDHLAAEMASEHLAFARTVDADGSPLEAGFMLPPRQVDAVVLGAEGGIDAYKRAVELPFAVEIGTNYLAPRGDELHDGEFAAAVVERADCDLLLDLHNIWANELNGRQPLAEVLAELPLERVTEVHVAGGFEFRGTWIDAHSGALDQRLLALLDGVIGRLPNVRTVVFEALPAFLQQLGGHGVRAQLVALQDALAAARRSRVAAVPRHPVPKHRPATDGAEVAAWEAATIRYTTRRTAQAPSDDPGYQLLRSLTDSSRLSRLSAVAPLELADALRAERADGPQLSQYLATHPTDLWPEAEGRAFRTWLGMRP